MDILFFVIPILFKVAECQKPRWVKFAYTTPHCGLMIDRDTWEIAGRLVDKKDDNIVKISIINVKTNPNSTEINVDGPATPLCTLDLSDNCTDSLNNGPAVGCQCAPSDDGYWIYIKQVAILEQSRRLVKFLYQYNNYYDALIEFVPLPKFYNLSKLVYYQILGTKREQLNETQERKLVTRGNFTLRFCLYDEIVVRLKINHYPPVKPTDNCIERSVSPTTPVKLSYEEFVEGTRYRGPRWCGPRAEYTITFVLPPPRPATTTESTLPTRPVASTTSVVRITPSETTGNRWIYILVSLVAVVLTGLVIIGVVMYVLKHKLSYNGGDRVQHVSNIELFPIPNVARLAESKSPEIHTKPNKTETPATSEYEISFSLWD